MEKIDVVASDERNLEEGSAGRALDGSRIMIEFND